MSKVIQKHTEEIRKERLAHKRNSGERFGSFGLDPMKSKGRIGTDLSNMTSVMSEMDSYLKTARMQSSNTGAYGGWSVSKRLPPKPYQPMLKDTYPRNEYTMMSEVAGPKYYTGHFLKYDYKEQPQKPEVDESRPVVFKTQNIERVQTKKKYGQNMKSQSSVPLHLCNDPTSLLYQRSLQPSTRDRTHLEADLRDLRSTVSRYPYALHKTVKNDESVLNPLNYNATTQTWVNTSYPTGHALPRRRLDTATTTFGYDRSVDLNDKDLKSGRIRSNSAPEWFSDLFPRQRVADTMKFMGQPKTLNQSPRKQEFAINFDGKK